MTIAIGRAGRDSGLTLNSPSYWNVNGDQVEAAGALTASTYAKLILLRAQVNGLADNRDEPVVPVNWTGDASVDGFYEVLDASVPMPARGIAALKLDWRVRLRKVGVYPDLNSVLVGNAVRTNSHTIGKGSTVPWWGTPADATMDYVPGASTATRVADSGSVKVAYTTNGTVLYNTNRRWACAASDYYDGACKVELYDGIGFYTLAGLWLPNTPVTDGWRINNGLVRVSYGAGNGLIKVEHYISGSWSVSKTYKLTRGTPLASTTALGPFTTITVVRNSPECVVLRLGIEQDSTTYPAQVALDLVLRRGALWVEGTLTRAADQTSSAELASTSFPLGIQRNTAEAGATHTSGVHANAADAQGGKYILTSPTATTVETTTGSIIQGTGVNLFQFMIGYEPGSATGPNTFTNQVYSYFAAVEETVGVARR